MTNKANLIARVVFGLFTAGLVTVTFYFPLVGLGYAINPSGSFESRGTGVLLLLPSVALLVLLCGMILPVRKRALWWLGIGGTVLLLPSMTAAAWTGFPLAIGTVAGFVYLGVWWFLAINKSSGLDRPINASCPEETQV